MTEKDTQNLMISPNWSTALMDYKFRGILAEDDEYRMRKPRVEDKDEQ